MIVKKKILIFFFLIGNFHILLSLYYSNFAIGFFWYSLNSNSLIGLQSHLEKYSYFFNSLKIDINKYLLFFLDINLFFILGIIFLMLPCFLSIKLSSS